MMNIFSRLKNGEKMPFSEFMHRALYSPHEGYYSGGLQKFGADGDFVTAPELTPLFGKTLANQCQPILMALKNPIIFEFGAGSGRLCVDVLMHLEHLGCLPCEYHILEVSPSLKARQERLIAECIPHLLHTIRWQTQWPLTSFEGVVIANEVLDAMPVSRFMKTSDGLLESFIVLNEQDELTEMFLPCENTRLIAHVSRVLPNEMSAYQSEVNLFIDDWLQQVYQMLARGAVFLLDYGFPRHEYYHSDRRHGTLMCHYRHRAHANPLVHVGEQDITAHVDFTHVAEAGVAAGFHVAGFTNQASFLLANGLLSFLAEIVDERERMVSSQAVKQLIQPNEMGELFKVMALTKDLDLTLQGFLLQDKRASL